MTTNYSMQALHDFIVRAKALSYVGGKTGGILPPKIT